MLITNYENNYFHYWTLQYTKHHLHSPKSGSTQCRKEKFSYKAKCINNNKQGIANVMDSMVTCLEDEISISNNQYNVL